MNPVTTERMRNCLRCKNRFVEPADTVTRLCDSCKKRGTDVYVSPTNIGRNRR